MQYVARTVLRNLKSFHFVKDSFEPVLSISVRSSDPVEAQVDQARMSWQASWSKDLLFG